MMVPMAMAVLLRLKESYSGRGFSRFSVGLLIGIAYAASIGGTATLIGTPPNAAFVRIFEITFPQAPQVSFATWFVFGVPFALVFLVVAWFVLCALSVSNKGGEMGSSFATIKEESEKLEPMSFEEKAIAVLFCILAVLWLWRGDIDLGTFVIPGWANMVSAPGYIDDGTIAILIAVILFVIPSRTPGQRLMDWETAQKLQWGIVLLFGGGFALAAGFKESGLSLWLGDQLGGLQDAPDPVIVVSICTAITFLTELTSNTATTQIILPILGSMAVAIKTNPLLLMVPATLSASCAFMLPVATPPNAIVFGTGEVTMKDMIRLGILLNLIGICLITIYLFVIGVKIFDIEPSVVPSWAAGQ